jgi:hypothetical protein
MLAPAVADSLRPPGEQVGELGDAEDYVPITNWRLRVSSFGIVMLVLMVPGAIGAFEIAQLTERRHVDTGPIARQLTLNPWQLMSIEGDGHGEGQGGESILPSWCFKGIVWKFEDSGKAWTGKVGESPRRFERDPNSGFRCWKWTLAGTEITLRGRTEESVASFIDPPPVEHSEADLAFAIEKDEKGQLYLNGTRDGWPTLVLRSCEPVKTFPELRVVFYAGAIAPLLVTWLLTWLISRELVQSGWLRFTLGWPLMVMIGLAIGAGAGFLLDVLDDFSHVAPAYRLQFAFLQGGLGLVFGFWLGVMSWLRTG